jgi:hypothetical protein
MSHRSLDCAAEELFLATYPDRDWQTIAADVQIDWMRKAWEEAFKSAEDDPFCGPEPVRKSMLDTLVSYIINGWGQHRIFKDADCTIAKEKWELEKEAMAEIDSWSNTDLLQHMAWADA